MGTRFMATKEAPVKDGIKDALVRGDERSTTLVMKSVGNTERVYRNAVAEEVRAIEAKTPGKIEAIRHLVSGENYRKSFQETGDPNTSVWSAGIVMGLIDDVPSCAELMAHGGGRGASSPNVSRASSSRRADCRNAGRERSAVVSQARPRGLITNGHS